MCPLQKLGLYTAGSYKSTSVGHHTGFTEAVMPNISPRDICRSRSKDWVHLLQIVRPPNVLTQVANGHTESRVYPFVLIEIWCSKTSSFYILISCKNLLICYMMFSIFQDMLVLQACNKVVTSYVKYYLLKSLPWVS